MILILRRTSHAIYAIVWSAIIGMLTAGYLNLINWIIKRIWGPYLLTGAIWYPFIICIPFGFLIGFLNKKLGDYPLTIKKVLYSVKKEGKVNYHDWWKTAVLGLSSLGAGGSIGPEASTTVLVSSMINWLGDRLRWASQFNKNIWFAKMPKQELEKSDKFGSLFSNKKVEKLIITLLTLVGVAGAAFIFKLFPEKGVFGIHNRIIFWSWSSLLNVVPALIVGFGFGYFFVHLKNWFAILINERINKIWQGGIFGLILALSTLISVNMLFSGEFRIVPFSEEMLRFSVLYLLIIGIGKAVVTNLGFVMGWRGGTIFPAIFCSVAIGGALAQMLPGDPRITIAIVLTTSLMMILRNAPLVIILLMLLISVQLLPIVIAISVIIAWIQKNTREI